MNGSRSILLGAALLSLATVSACSDATGTRRVPLSLSFATKSFAAKASVSSPSGFAADLIVGTGGDLVITKAQVVFDGIELSHDDGPNCDGTGEFQCENVEQSAQLVDIPLTTGVKTQLTVAVPVGTYQRLDAHIQVPRSDDAGVTAFLAAHPEFKDVSVRVEGTFGPNKGQRVGRPIGPRANESERGFVARSDEKILLREAFRMRLVCRIGAAQAREPRPAGGEAGG